MEFQASQIFGLISFFLSNRQLWVVLDGKSSQEYPVNTGVLQGSILGPALFLLYWLFILNLIYETLWTGAGSDMLISMLKKLDWFHLTGLIILVLLMWKWMGKNHLLRFWGWLSIPNWIGALTYISLLKKKSLQENWSLDLFYEVTFSWGYSVSL